MVRIGHLLQRQGAIDCTWRELWSLSSKGVLVDKPLRRKKKNFAPCSHLLLKTHRNCHPAIRIRNVPIRNARTQLAFLERRKWDPHRCICAWLARRHAGFEMDEVHTMQTKRCWRRDALHYITLHYITLPYMYIYNCIYICTTLHYITLALGVPQEGNALQDVQWDRVMGERQGQTRFPCAALCLEGVGGSKPSI